MTTSITTEHPYYVNALLYPDAKWTDVQGSPVRVTYSFMTQVPDYYASDAEERNNSI